MMMSLMILMTTNQYHLTTCQLQKSKDNEGKCPIENSRTTLGNCNHRFGFCHRRGHRFQCNSCQNYVCQRCVAWTNHHPRQEQRTHRCFPCNAVTTGYMPAVGPIHSGWPPTANTAAPQNAKQHLDDNAAEQQEEQMHQEVTNTHQANQDAANQQPADSQTDHNEAQPQEAQTSGSQPQ